MPSRRDPRREELRKSRARLATRAETHSQEEFVAQLVSLDALCAVMHRAEAAGRAVEADRLASWVASRQLSLITTPQLTICGIGRRGQATRRRRGQLHRVHYGVHLFGQPTFLPGTRELAAVLACGDLAFVSHRSAIVLRQLIAPVEGPVEITVIGHDRRHEGITSHRVSDLHPEDRDLHNGIPITSPARALLDFASQAQDDELERAIAEAYAQQLTDETELRAVLARYPHRAGAAPLRAELDRAGGPAWSRSEAERRMKLLLRRARLPFPRTNLRLAGYQADFLWPKQRLIVEVDGFQFHGHRYAFERDRKRDAAHVLAGYRVIRITWRQLTEEPMAVAVTIARALEQL